MSEKPAPPPADDRPRTARRQNVGRARKAKAKSEISRIVTMRDTQPSAREEFILRRARGV